MPIPDEHSEGEFIVVQVPLFSVDVRVMIDNMLFKASWLAMVTRKCLKTGCQKGSNHHSRIQELWLKPPFSLSGIVSVPPRNTRENEDNFYSLWKQCEICGKKDSVEVEKQQTDGLKGVMGDDDDDGAAAGGAAESENGS